MATWYSAGSMYSVDAQGHVFGITACDEVEQAALHDDDEPLPLLAVFFSESDRDNAIADHNAAEALAVAVEALTRLYNSADRLDDEICEFGKPVSSEHHGEFQEALAGAVIALARIAELQNAQPQ